jgi:putative flippase GtrA
MKRWWKFNAVGVVGMAVHFSLLALLMHFGMHYLWATVLSVEAAILQKFWWHQKWTWADRQVTGAGAVTTFLRFNLANALVLLSSNTLTVWMLTSHWQVHPILANLAAIPCGIANFFLTDRLVFLPVRPSQDATKPVR